MIEQTGDTYLGSKYAKSLFVGGAKMGKSTFLVASALGLLPWQKHGGVVSRPEDLHVLTFDSSALSGIKDFLIKELNAPPEATKFNVWNYQDDVRKISQSESDYDHGLFGSLTATRNKISDRTKGTDRCPVVLVSSLTGLALAMERAIIGPPTGGKSGKGYGDQSKWKMVSSQLFEIQNLFQIDQWHCLWEGHLSKKTKAAVGQGQPAEEVDSLSVSGAAGKNWGYNVEQIFAVRRQFGQPFTAGKKCDKVYMDTKPTLDFVANSRGATTALEDREVDLTEVYQKLGLRTGNWGKK